jgi:hypothetical protein
MSHREFRNSALKPRPAIRLNPTAENKLLGYGAAAAAAGIGLLALAQPAAAKIVFTPTHQTIMPNQTIKLDLNNDGVSEFSLRIFNTHLSGVYQTGRNDSSGSVNLAGLAGSDKAVRATSILGFVDALASNAKVGGSDQFESGVMVDCTITNGGSGGARGPWVKQKNKFLGVKFAISGQTHYGWVRLSVQQIGRRACDLKALVTGYAYENTPNTPILAGQRSGANEVGSLVPDLNQAPLNTMRSLGLLAQGAPALAIWRREEDLAA